MLRDQPAHPGAQHVRQRQRQPRKQRSSWPSSWFFVAVRVSTRRCRCAAHAASSASTGGQGVTRHSATGQQQLGDRLQIQRVGLDPPPAHHPPLLGHAAPGSAPPPPNPATPMEPSAVGDSGLHPHPGTPAQHRPRPGDHPGHTAGGHRELQRAEQPMPSSVTDQHRRLRLAHIHRDYRSRRRKRTIERHTHLQGCQEDRRSNARSPTESDGSLLTPPEVI